MLNLKSLSNSTSQESFRRLRGGILLLKFWPIFIIFGLVLAFAFPYWAQGKTPLPADYLVDAFPPWQYYFAHPVKNNAMPDVVTQMYPWKHLVMRLWKTGQIPLWNPFNFGGHPFLANYQSAVFHPLNWLFFILPEIDAWSIMILLQPLLAGFFTYLFCRQRRLSQGASLLASISFMFCGFITCWLAYSTLGFALLWLPLILYAMEKRAGWLVSLAMAASFFSGHFQTSLYVFLAAGAYAIYQKKFVFLIFLCLGLGLAAPQILPTFESHQLSPRHHFYQIGERVPFKHLLTILAPDFYGNPVTRNDRGHYAEWAGFAGVIPFLLACYAAAKKKSARFFVLLGLLSLLLTLPTPLLDWLEKLKLPVFSTSAASRIISLFSFSVAILAGFGFDQLRQDLVKKKIKPALFTAGIAVAGCLAVWLILLLCKPFDPIELAVSRRNFILPTGMIFAFGGLMAAYGLINKFFKKNKLITCHLSLIALSALLALTAFDLFRFTQKWQPFAQREQVYPNLPILEYLPEQSRGHRVFGNFGMEVQNYYQIQGLEGYDPMYSSRYGEFLVFAGRGHFGKSPMRGVNLAKGGLYTREVLNLLNVKYLLHALPDGHNVWAFAFWDYPDEFKKVYGDETYEVYENLKAYPAAFMVYDYQVASEPHEILDLVFDEQTDLRQIVILEEEPVVKPASPPKNPSTVAISDFSANQIDLVVQTDQPGLLFLSENFFPGWQATVSSKGRSASGRKIYRANYSFRAVAVPAGQSEVKFVYRPNSFKWGLRLSLFSLAVIILLGSKIGLRRGRQGA